MKSKKMMYLIPLGLAVMSLIAIGMFLNDPSEAGEKSKNKEFARHYFEEMDKRQTLPEELLGSNFTAHYHTDPPMDLNGVKHMSGAFYSAFPDLKHDIQDMINEGDKVTIRMIVRGTHKGDFMGIAPTGKKVAIAAIGVGRIADGKLVEQWVVFDQMGLMQQIGAIPAPGH